MANLLILLNMPEEIRTVYRDRLRAKFPALTINVCDHRSKIGPYIAGADALLTFTPMMSDDVVRDGAMLKWIQTLGSGVDNLIDLPSLRKDVIVTNVHGIHGAPVS
jgi:D-2-hydroxyacid dehydrogenase (NADP+)